MHTINTGLYLCSFQGNRPNNISTAGSFLIIFDLIIQHITQIHMVKSTRAMARDFSANFEVR